MTKISIFEDLLLFRISDGSIIFCPRAPYATSDGTYVNPDVKLAYKGYSREQLTINIGAANAKVPSEPFSMKVEDIVDNSFLE